MLEVTVTPNKHTASCPFSDSHRLVQRNTLSKSYGATKAKEESCHFVLVPAIKFVILNFTVDLCGSHHKMRGQDVNPVALWCLACQVPQSWAKQGNSEIRGILYQSLCPGASNVPQQKRSIA